MTQTGTRVHPCDLPFLNAPDERLNCRVTQHNPVMAAQAATQASCIVTPLLKSFATQFGTMPLVRHCAINRLAWVAACAAMTKKKQFGRFARGSESHFSVMPAQAGTHDNSPIALCLPCVPATVYPRTSIRGRDEREDRTRMPKE
jgi:hypothetical protein